MPRGPGPSYLQPRPSQDGPPSLGLRSSPLTRRGYRGTEISGFVTLYLSQASAVGSDRPGLAQRRRLFCISHKAKKGFWIPVAVRWDYRDGGGGISRVKVFHAFETVRALASVSGLFEVELKSRFGVIQWFGELG